MLRLVLLVLAFIAIVYLAIRLSKELSRPEVDWRGVGLAAGFVVLAFYLSNATGIGGV